MSELPRGNPKIPEGINAHNEHPFTEFLQLLLGVAGGFVLLLAVLLLSVELLTSHIPFSWEQKAEALVARYLEDDAQRVDTDAQQALATLGAALVQTQARMDRPDTPAVPPDAYRFHLLHSDAANAYATLGGHIIVTDALLRQVRSENGLSMVIAHEIAHIHHRHPIAGASRALVLQLVLQALLGGSADGPLTGLLSGSSMLAMLNFNREMETDADARALDIVAQHYGTLRGADEFFASMADSDNSALWLEFTQTHPNVRRRLDVIRQRQQQSGLPQAVLTPLPPALVVAEKADAGLTE